ncbi:hypothetical protein PZB75_08800 [Streptomyces sp. AM 4-1-1]|uniref:hypothetical protein n=1 Tax=Streptomyces sp. AM 4-1-1 TaxID=3028710 RepID=UPI0023B9D821|nr:hypothetical protein [Streptomyces sp. AM 4-1-1]WEH33468.1 hypothetical protein PZB75_08800 [Streptomyces sp. AM 4-1-1]
MALLTTAHCDRYIATRHMLPLLAGLPVPTDEPYEDFWFKLWQASGTAYFMPGNMGASVLPALDCDGVGLADRLLSAFDEMTAEQWDAAAKVIWEALDERIVAYAPTSATAATPNRLRRPDARPTSAVCAVRPAKADGRVTPFTAGPRTSPRRRT